MIPGITIGRVEHDIESTKFGYGRSTVGSLRETQQIASDGKTIAMITHTAATMTSTSVNVYYTTNFGVSWTAVPGTPLTSTGWATSADVSIGGIVYADGKWIVGLGDSRIAYTTNITSNWSTWTITGTALTSLGWGLISFNNNLDPKWVVRNNANNTTRVNSTTFGTWNAPTNSVGANCEEFTSGKLGGSETWVAACTTGSGISTLSGSTFQTKTSKTYPGTVNLRALVYFPEESLWIAACDNEVIYTSPDSGTDFTWTARSTPTMLTDYISLVYIKGVGVICGTAPVANTSSANSSGRIMFTKNGINWSLISAFDDSTAAYGYGHGGIDFNGGALMMRAENTSGGTPSTTVNASWYTSVLVADR